MTVSGRADEEVLVPGQFVSHLAGLVALASARSTDATECAISL